MSKGGGHAWRGSTPEATVADVIRQHLPHPVVGDRLRLGELQLVVRKVAGDRPVEIGLRLPH